MDQHASFPKQGQEIHRDASSIHIGCWFPESTATFFPIWTTTVSYIYILYYHISDYIIYYIIYLYHLCKSYWKPHPKKVYQVHLGSLGYLEIWPRSQDDPSLYGPVSGPLLCIALACERKPGMGCCVEDPCGEQNSLHVRKPCDVRETSTRDHFLNLASILDFSRYWDSQYLHGIDCP